MIGDKLKVKGTAIVECTSRNKIRYTAEELSKGSTSLAGVTIIKDHEATTDNSVGKVETQTFSEGKQCFDGWVEEDGTNLLQKIKDRRVKVSVGAMVDKLVREEEDSDVLTAKGIRYMELSLTPTPGVPDAEIMSGEKVVDGITESFDKKQIRTSLTEQEISSLVESLACLKEEKVVEAEKVEAEKVVEAEIKSCEVSQNENPNLTEEAPQSAKENEGDKMVEENKITEQTPEVPVAEKQEVKDDAVLKENEKLKLEIAEMQKKLEEAKKMEEQKVVEKKSLNDEPKTSVFEGYVLEKEKDGKVAFYKMPRI